MNVLPAELLAEFDESVRAVDEARTLPPAVYRSQAFYEFERDAVFGHDWLCVGRADQIPEPGDFRSIELVGEPLLVVRGRDGVIRVLSSVCQHRGMVVEEGNGNCSRFTCPYHHWSYGLDGSLLGAPAMERAVDFDKGLVCLPALKVEVWRGFIFANFDPDAPPLAPSLHRIEPLLEHFNLDTAVTRDGKKLEHVPWNWKVMLENFNDPYHASRLHGPLQTFAPSHLNEFLPWSDEDGAVGRVQHFTHKDGSFNPTQRCLLPVFPDLTDAERSQGMFILIPPSLCLAVVPDEVAYFIVSPEGPGHITLHIGYCFDASALKHPLFEQLFVQAEDGVDNFNREDIWADEMVQVGLRSRFAPRGRYSWQEETLQQFNRWLVARYRRWWPAESAAVRAGTASR
jgi:phenylpropionate dioxygenase-like ring-hydroxylating dioxygenase large terminal subunit